MEKDFTRNVTIEEDRPILSTPSLSSLLAAFSYHIVQVLFRLVHPLCDYIPHLPNRRRISWNHPSLW
uniref:Uncharacterized protein n=1 Tax=Arundo donax TaxID=35708 RepID=A0A0A9BMV0_ARUDO